MSELTPLRNKVRHTKFLVVDIESKDGDSQKAGFTRPFMVGVYDGEKYYAFFDTHSEGDWERRYYWEDGCVDRALRFILQRKYRGYTIYAHNAGRFDYLFFMPWFLMRGDRLGFRFTVMPVSSAIQLLEVWNVNENGKRRGGWRFLDSYKLIPMSLDKAAKTFGQTGKIVVDLNTPETERKLWGEYNREDCIQLYDVMTKFHHYVEKVLMGEVGMTAPSTAVKLLRRKYLPGPVERSEETHEFIRRGYVGGRVEKYIEEGYGLRYYDFNSSYPASMLELMPGSLIGEYEGEVPKSTLQDSRSVGFVEADVRVPDGLQIPPLPIRGDGKIAPAKLIFPTGNLTGVWEWSELQHAVDCGCEIVNWKHSVWYEGFPLFKEFVQDLYKYRDKSLPDFNEGLAAIAKIMLNSAYGKFGMKTERSKIWLWNDPDLPDDAVPASHGPDSVVWYSKEVVDAPYIMPQVAARVTALSRVKLHRAMMEALRLGGKVYYCDTDSVITDIELPSSTKLGELKDEYPEQSGKLHGVFVGPKMYLIDSDVPLKDGKEFLYVKLKGFEKRTRDTLERLRRGEKLTQRRLEKIGMLARANFERGPKEFMVPRRMQVGGEKRQQHADGTTTPFHLMMWE